MKTAESSKPPEASAMLDHGDGLQGRGVAVELRIDATLVVAIEAGVDDMVDRVDRHRPRAAGREGDVAAVDEEGEDVVELGVDPLTVLLRGEDVIDDEGRRDRDHVELEDDGVLRVERRDDRVERRVTFGVEVGTRVFDAVRAGDVTDVAGAEHHAAVDAEAAARVERADGAARADDPDVGDRRAFTGEQIDHLGRGETFADALYSDGKGRQRQQQTREQTHP
jgi:hypothetical protein